MANLTMTNWRIVDKLPYIILGSAGENNASTITITVDSLIENANYYLDIGDESSNDLPNTQELTPNTNVGTNGETVYTLSMQPSIYWLGKEGVKLIQVRCVYTEDEKEVYKESNVFHGTVNKNSGFVYKYNIAVFEKYIDRIKTIANKLIQATSLAHLSDVNIASPQDNQVLTYDAENQKWINADNSGGGDTIQVTSLPSPTASELGKVYQYIGADSGGYKHGYFYELRGFAPYYTWEQVKVMYLPNGLYDGDSSDSGYNVKFNTNNNSSSGECSIAEGSNTQSSGIGSHSEGYGTRASGDASHAEGSNSIATSDSSHAEGTYSQAYGTYSHTQNEHTIARGKSQTVIGKYNVEQGSANTYSNTDQAFIIGNGTANNPSNAFAIQWDGTLVFANGETLTPSEITQLKALLN